MSKGPLTRAPCGDLSLEGMHDRAH